MTFSEAAMIMMSGGGSGTIKSLNVTTNGKYSAASYECSGFDPVDVNVPDRYEEGFLAGKNSVIDKIDKLVVTANGTYTKDEGGYNPVEVNVPNGYDEGYADGCTDTETNILNDPDNTIHKSIYDNGYNDGYEFGNAAASGGGVTRGNVTISVEEYPFRGEWYTVDYVGQDDVTVGQIRFACGIFARTFVDGVEKQTLMLVYTFNSQVKLQKWYVQNYDKTQATLCIQYSSGSGTWVEGLTRDIYKVFV